MPPSSFDIILRNGQVVDGTGAPPFRADVGILDSMIAAVGRLDQARAPKEIDVRDHYVVPGFVDAHVHGDLMLLADPIHLPALRQGVTTYVIGQDGSSFAPASPETMRYMRRYTAGFNGDPPEVRSDWNSVDEYLSAFDRTTAINVAYLVPNGNIRLEVVGHDPRPATPDEIRAMRQLVRKAMDEGAVGLSSGLDYLPSMNADARELAELCAEIAPFDGVYVTHMRAFGGDVVKSVDEVLEICERSGAAGHISHYNGRAEVLLPLVDRARARGFDLTYDSYPYEAGCTILGMLALPPETQAGGVEPTLERLADPAERQRLRNDWFRPAKPRFALDGIHIAMTVNPRWAWAEGKTVTAAAAESGRDVTDFVCDALLENELAVGVVAFGGDRDDNDIRAILRHPAHMAGSDGIFRGGHPHPRGWGAFARYLGRHTRELRDYEWGEAIVHLASHAARRFRLNDRGLVKTGYVADLAVIDPLAVTDKSTYANGRALAEGVPHVLVNGVLALENGQPTGQTPGRPLRRS